MPEVPPVVAQVPRRRASPTISASSRCGPMSAAAPSGRWPSAPARRSSTSGRSARRLRAGGGKPVKERPLQRRPTASSRCSAGAHPRHPAQSASEVLPGRSLPRPPRPARRPRRGRRRRRLRPCGPRRRLGGRVRHCRSRHHHPPRRGRRARRGTIDRPHRRAVLREREAALTREAIGRQVFGAPFYFFRDEPFWGQDRLDLLEAAISGSEAPIPLPDLSGSG